MIGLFHFTFNSAFLLKMPLTISNISSNSYDWQQQKTDYELKKEGSDLSQILTRKPALYQGIKTPEEAQRVYGGSGNYIIGQGLV